MQLRSLDRKFEVVVDMIGFVLVTHRGTLDEMAYLEAMKTRRWLRSRVTPSLLDSPANDRTLPTRVSHLGNSLLKLIPYFVFNSISRSTYRLVGIVHRKICE